MRHHSMVCRLGAQDTIPVLPVRADSHVTEITVVDGERRLGFGLGQMLDQLRELGLCPSEHAVDLAILAAIVTAADTRVSRKTESQDGWTREIDLYLPVADPTVWLPLADPVVKTLNFLTGDLWGVYFRPRPTDLSNLAQQPDKVRVADTTSVCLFSGGLDSFIGAIDLLAEGEQPIFVSHYWDGVSSKHQTNCLEVIEQRFNAGHLSHARARIGFPVGLVEASPTENSLRGRSFLFFAMASLVASALSRDVIIHVPENGLISLNVPLDPLRLGALSTRTTHPYYMARVNELIRTLGITARLENRYRHQTKGQMVRNCPDKDLLLREAKKTMSCSAPTKYRYSKDKVLRKPQHCGHCVPCLIRRAALVDGLGQDDTVYAIPDLHARVLDSNKAEGEHIRSFQFALARLTRNPGRARFDIHRPGPLSDHSDDLAAYETVYVEGLREVGRLLEGVRAQPL